MQNIQSMLSWSSLKEKYMASFIWKIVSFDSSSMVGRLFKPFRAFTIKQMESPNAVISHVHN